MDTETKIGVTFPYRFGLDFFQRKVVAYNTTENKMATFDPADLQRLANDETLDPHRHNLYQAAWYFWKSQKGF